MHGSQQVGEALEHKDLRRNRRRHSTNWFIFCNVEDSAEYRTLHLQERKVTLYTESESAFIGQVCVHKEFESGFKVLSMYLHVAPSTIYWRGQ